MKNKATTTANNNNLKFEIGEKVLCYQGSHIYEAKCIDKRKLNNSNNLEYLIHYNGWKSKYDEWVPSNRVLKYNDTNLKLQQDLRKNSEEKVNKKYKKDDNKQTETTNNKDKSIKLEKSDSIDKSDSTNNSNSVDPIIKNLNSKDIKVPSFVETLEEFLNKREVKIRIPEDLQLILCDDGELINMDEKLICLPSKMNIEQILDGYLENKKKLPKLSTNHSIDGYKDFITNIRQYFNFYIDKCLLYPSEKPQMEYLIKNYDQILSTKANDLKNQKIKKSNNNGNNKKQSTVFSESTNQQSSSSTVVIDQNSQSETSDSSSNSAEVSSSEEVQKNNNNNDIPINENETDEQQNDNKTIDFTKLYGAVHLLRLFSKLGQILYYSEMSSEELTLASSYVHDFLRYLSKNLGLFASESDTSYIDANLCNF